jgi:hypothetical protein
MSDLKLSTSKNSCKINVLVGHVVFVLIRLDFLCSTSILLASTTRAIFLFASNQQVLGPKEPADHHGRKKEAPQVACDGRHIVRSMGLKHECPRREHDVVRHWSQTNHRETQCEYGSEKCCQKACLVGRPGHPPERLQRVGDFTPSA